jgi:hypothetical protein
VLVTADAWHWVTSGGAVLVSGFLAAWARGCNIYLRAPR